MSYTPPNPNGQATMANSSPVVIASDQSAVPVSGTITSNIGTTNGLALDATLTGGTQQVQGNIASGSTDSGNPLKVGGVNRTTQPTLTDGQRGDAQLDTRSNIKTVLFANNTATAITVSATNADGRATSATASRFEVVNDNYIYNGTTYDRQVSVINGTNSTGTGIAAAGLLAQLDDTSPTSIAENQFGNLRIDTARQLRVNNQSAPDSTLLNTYSTRITTNTTTTPTSSTAYISSIVICVETAGTTSTIDIRDKSGTPIYLIRSLSTAAILGNGDLVYDFQTPIKMTSGIDIITGGAGAATLGVFINYFQ